MRPGLLRVLVGVAACLWLGSTTSGQQPKFFRDDPLQREPETQDASKVQEWDIPLAADIILNLFGKPGDRTLNQRARNVNTIDEVPDSSWFTNRIHARAVSLDEIRKGPNTIDGPAAGKWTVIRAKSAGVAPGFTVRDEKGEVWFLTFDSRQNPIAPTAAVAVATRLFWALGYNQVESYLATIRPENLVVGEKVTVRAHGKRQPFTMADVRDVLARSARSADGSYRVIAGRGVPGRTLGGFKYFGTRPDDPNDIVPHEHRRELRALQVFGAWTNLVDMKAGNTLDTLISENGRGIVKHYLQDVGSTFGTGALNPRDGDEGYEYIYEGGPTLRRLVTFGFWLSPWQTVDFREHPEVGRFEGRQFEPEKWKPRVPVAALRHVRDDDAFWAARRVMAFTDEQIRAAVSVGGFTDKAAEKLLADVLIERRNKIGRTYYTRINPLVDFQLSDAGVLTFVNAAVAAQFGPAPAQGYEAVCARFNNTSGQAEPIGAAVTATDARLQCPSLPSAADQHAKISVKARQPQFPAWGNAVDVYFRRSGAGWTLVGVDRVVK
jgi:hypothetical protein